MTQASEPQNSNTSENAGVARAAAGLKLYDTASHTVSRFTPIKPGQVGIYVCGATVQSSPHIGHIRAAVAFDVVRRWMLRLGYQVTFVRNVTDIDDKILDKAAAAGQQWWARAYFYEREFTQAYDTLGVLPPTYEPRATGHMIDMIDLIRRIIDNGHGYVVYDADGKPTGNVYFDVASWPHYGELTHQKQGAAEADEAAAVADRMGPSVDAAGDDKYNPIDPADASPDKHDPRDFALWKAPKPTDPQDARWSTPFGVGRPGWHIECSAMSHKYLGDTFDFHGGGSDLIFPHHENEIAQSEAYTGKKPMVKYWLHNGFITINSEKMSKSLNNFFLVKDVLAHYSPDALRFFLISNHYRSPLDFSDERLDEMTRSLERLGTAIDNVLELMEMPAGSKSPEAEQLLAAAKKDEDDFETAMCDDFNTALASAAMFDLAKNVNIYKNAVVTNDVPVDSAIMSEVKRIFKTFTDILGILEERWEGQKANASSKDYDDLMQVILDIRQECRVQKQFALADAIRNKLAALGITIEDSPQGARWKK